ncbi:MAG: hypothetical protein ABL308_02300 [Oceanicaulis sp.]
MAHTDQTKSGADGEAGRAAERAGEAAHEARRAGEDLGRAAADLGEERAEQGRERAYKSLETASDRLREAGSDLKDQDERLAGELIDRAAQGLGQAAGFLRERRTGDMLHDVQEFGRRNPAAFLGASAAVGLLISRVAKTAAERQQTGPTGRTSDDLYREG